MTTQRTRVLQRADAPHPVVGLLEAADPHQLPAPEPTAARGSNQPAAAPAPSPDPAPAAAPAPRPDPAPERGKKQVNYRLDPGLIEELKKASIDYSYRQGQQYSQNRIVEMAVREWLDANGPWQH